jgi:hypothetical protein
MKSADTVAKELMADLRLSERQAAVVDNSVNDRTLTILVFDRDAFPRIRITEWHGWRVNKLLVGPISPQCHKI